MSVPNDLPDSVLQLARPRLALRTERDSWDEVLCGIWGGSGVVPLPSGVHRPHMRHRISVDCQWLEANGFGVSGCLSVYADGLNVVVVNDPDLLFRTASHGFGVALFGLEEVSWPEDEALEAYLGKAEVASVLSAEWAKEYFAHAQQCCPLYSDDVVAVVGGWHVSWPDGPPDLPRLAALQQRINRAGGPGAMPAGETFRCEPYRLLLWTLRDSEPWYEVWGDGEGELHAVGRVT